MAQPVVRVRGVTRSYGAVQALRGIDLEIEPGEVFALLGPNGAGKTTLVEILEGFRRRSGGQASVLGVDPGRGGAAWRARLGIVLQSTTVFDELTPDELVRHFSGFYPDPLDPDRVIAMAGLEEKRSTRCSRLSGGQKRRVDLALGIIGNPEIMFLDEPTTGFDPAARRQAWDVVRGLTTLGKTVVLTTHYLDEAEALADRVAVIIAGAIAASGTPRDIGGRARGLARVRFLASGPLGGRQLPACDGEVRRDGDIVSVTTARPTVVVAELAAWAAALGATELPELSVVRPSLEDVYLAMVASAGAAADGGAE